MPEWVENCVRDYMKKGVPKDEAWKRCNGAYGKQKKKKHKKGKH